MNKTEFRKVMLTRASALPEEEKSACDAGILKKLLSLPEYVKAKRVFSYIGVGDEISTRTAVKKLLSDGKEAYVPLCRAKGEMDAVRIHSLSELSPGRFGIPEPPAGEAKICPEALDMIIVPGVAFGCDGTRLGRGGGYYDRFLVRAEGAAKIALCREINLCETVPVEAHDEKVDIIVTERRVIKI